MDFLQLQPLLCLAEDGVKTVSSFCQKFYISNIILYVFQSQTILLNTPGVLAGGSMMCFTIFGANARGFRDSICWRDSRTISSYSGLL